VGNGSLPLKEDEIRVAAPDDYNGLPFKTLGIAKWASAQDYDYAFLCDTDTFVRPELFSCPFEDCDYSGYYHDRNIAGRMFTEYIDDRGQRQRNGHWWASGGVGYFLSRRALQAVAAAQPSHWAEDFWVGQVIGALYQKGQMTVKALQPFASHICWHFSKHAGRSYETRWMRDAYKHGRPAW
jgi:hypothetical protein